MATESGSDKSAIGILGGTFDPIHVGHLALARHALETLDLEEVLFVPNSDPPHKQGRIVSPAADREAMVAAAIADEPATVLSRLELDREGLSYAVDTVAEVAGRSRREGRPDPWFILSAEALEEFDGWRDPERILEACRLAVAPRAGSEVAAQDRLVARFPGFEDRFTFLDGPDVDVSSTDIRDRVASGAAIDHLVPPGVDRYIRAHSLYRPAGSPAAGVADRATDEVSAASPTEGNDPTGDGSGSAVDPVDPVDADVLSLAHLIVEAASDKKAADIVLLDVRSQTTMTDYFVLCSGASDRQLGAIADGIIEAAKGAGAPLVSREGDASSHWLLIDFGGVIVHVMSAPEREFYQLEKLWSDAKLLLHIL